MLPSAATALLPTFLCQAYSGAKSRRFRLKSVMYSPPPRMAHPRRAKWPTALEKPYALVFSHAPSLISSVVLFSSYPLPPIQPQAEIVARLLKFDPTIEDRATSQGDTRKLLPVHRRHGRVGLRCLVYVPNTRPSQIIRKRYVPRWGGQPRNRTFGLCSFRFSALDTSRSAAARTATPVQSCSAACR